MILQCEGNLVASNTHNAISGLIDYWKIMIEIDSSASKTHHHVRIIGDGQFLVTTHKIAVALLLAV